MGTQAATGHSGRHDEKSTDSGFDTSRDITADRFRRTLREPMVVVFDAPLLARVRHGDATYTVDLIAGSCQCDDYHYRGHSVVCKHALRAALAALYTEANNTAFMAHVARHSRDTGCPEDINGCRGPTAPADWDGHLPCARCVDAVRAPSVDEYVVWSAFAPRSDGDRR